MYVGLRAKQQKLEEGTALSHLIFKFMRPTSAQMRKTSVVPPCVNKSHSAPLFQYTNPLPLISEFQRGKKKLHKFVIFLKEQFNMSKTSGQSYPSFHGA